LRFIPIKSYSAVDAWRQATALLTAAQSA
jgi:hypothetical protein